MSVLHEDEDLFCHDRSKDACQSPEQAEEFELPFPSPLAKWERAPYLLFADSPSYSAPIQFLFSPTNFESGFPRGQHFLKRAGRRSHNNRRWRQKMRPSFSLISSAFSKYAAALPLMMMMMMMTGNSSLGAEPMEVGLRGMTI